MGKFITCEKDEEGGISAFKQLENTEHDGEKLPGERLEKRP